MKKKFNKFKLLVTTNIFLLTNSMLTFATAPDKSKVESVATDGIKMFFGALGGIAVVLGGIEFFRHLLHIARMKKKVEAERLTQKLERKYSLVFFAL